MRIDHQYGFTLVEISIVLVVVGLLLGTTIAGLSDFIWHARNAQAKKDLALIEEALIGFAISNGGLPCPDGDGYQNNPAAADGVANVNIAGTACLNVNGYLPWTDLGLRARDPWGNPYFYRVHPNYVKPNPGDQTVTFTLATSDGTIAVRNANGGALVANSIAAIVFSIGPNGIVTPADASNDEDENLDNDVTFVDKTYKAATPGDSGFDDILHWLSTFSLKARMVEAHRLP